MRKIITVCTVLCMLMSVFSSLSAWGSVYGSGWYGELQTTVDHNDNISRAAKKEDRQTELFTTLSIGTGYLKKVGETAQFDFTGYLSKTLHRNAKDLESLTASLATGIVWQPHVRHDTPWYHASLSWQKLIYDDSAIREGNLYDFELGVSKRLSLATTGFLTWRYLQRQATTGKVYDMTTSEYLIGAERLLTSRLTAFIEYRFRDGDQVSSASPHNINTVTDASWKDSAFEACDEHGCWPLYAYRTEGESHHLAAGAAYKLDDAINIELGVSYLDAESDASLSYRSWSFRLALTYHIKP